MKSFILGNILCFSGLLPLTSSAQSPATQDAVPVPASNVVADTVDVEDVIDAYHAALMAHDGARSYTSTSQQLMMRGPVARRCSSYSEGAARHVPAGRRGISGRLNRR